MSNPTDDLAREWAKQPAYVGPGHPAPEGPRREVTRDTTPDPFAGMTPEQRNKAAMWDAVRNVAADELPSALAMAATLPIGGEGALAVPLLGRLLPAWGTRMVAAQGASTAGALGGQALRGEPLDIGKAVRRGNVDAFTQGIGEVGVGVSSAFGRDSYRRAFRVSPTDTRAAVKAASRQAGARVNANDVALADQGLAERVPLGHGNGWYGGTGMDRIEGLEIGPTADLAQALSEAGTLGEGATISDLLGELHALRAQVALERGGAKRVAVIDREIADLYKQWSLNNGRIPKGATMPVEKVLSPEQVSKLKTTWQGQVNYRAPQTPRTALEQRIDAALARGARKWLEAMKTEVPYGLNQPPVGQRTFGDVVRNANQRLERLHPLKSAVEKVETNIAGGGTMHVPWYQHTVPPVIGAGAGYLAHGPSGAALGSGAGLLFDKLLANPAIASRIGLTLTDPTVQAAMRQAPRGADMLRRLFQEPSVPDVLGPRR